jgi:hypothetical protein
MSKKRDFLRAAAPALRRRSSFLAQKSKHSKKSPESQRLRGFLARPRGFEPPTYRLGEPTNDVELT